MREISYTPPTDYWQQIRRNEDQIYQRNSELTPVICPGVDSVEVWTPETIEYTGHDAEAMFDTVVYSAKRLSVLSYASRTALLSLFSDDEIGGYGLVRVFQLDLLPGKEKLRTFSIYSQLGTLGITDKSKSVMSQQNRMTKHYPISLPNVVDYEFISNEFQRNKDDAFTRWSPRKSGDDLF